MKYKALSLALCLSFCGVALAEKFEGEEQCKAAVESVVDAAKKSQDDTDLNSSNDKNDQNNNEDQEIEVAEKFNDLIRKEHERVRKAISDFVQENSHALRQHVGKIINFKFEIGLEDQDSLSSNKSLESQDEPCSDCSSCDDVVLEECNQSNC